MQRFRDSILANSSSGLRPLANATVTVYLAGTTTPASIYSDNGGASKVNPFQSDALGVVDFYAPDGRYDLYIRHPDYEPVWVRDLLLNDPVDDGITTTNSTTVTFSGSGAQATPLAAAAKVSATEGNALVVDDEGLYVPPSAGGVPEAPTDGELYARGGTDWQVLGTAATAAASAFATASQGQAADSAVQPDDLASVATSGSYNDLDDKPIIPGAQVYPDAGMAVSTGTGWDASKTAPTGDVVGTSDAQTLTNKTIGAASKESVSTGSTITINDAAAPFQQITLAANATATINLSVGVSRTIWINPAAFTVTWPAGTVWVGGTAPDLPASKWAEITFNGVPGGAAGSGAFIVSLP